MSIQETVHFDKNGEVESKASWRGRIRGTFHKIFLALVILLVATLSYGAGRLTAGQGTKSGVSIRYDEGIIAALSNSSSTTVSVVENPLKTANSKIENSAPRAQGSVYASSKGTKYYYMNCKSSVGAANKITFASATLAEQAGYTLASVCKAQ
jgi:hypothetical protein